MERQISWFFWLQSYTNILVLFFSFIGKVAVLKIRKHLYSVSYLCREKRIYTPEHMEKCMHDDRVLQIYLFWVVIALLPFILIQAPIFLKNIPSTGNCTENVKLVILLTRLQKNVRNSYSVCHYNLWPGSDNNLKTQNRNQLSTIK